jgi:hypothetical protein
MGKQDVDVIQTETLEGQLRSLHNVLAREASIVGFFRTVTEEDFGRDDQFGALS